MSDQATFNSSIQWTATVETTNGDIVLPNIAASTQKLEISASVNSLYLYGEWIFSVSPVVDTSSLTQTGYPGLNNLMENGYLSIGTIIRFEFADQNGILTTIRMGILKVMNGPGVDTIGLAQSHGLILISPWFFFQQVLSNAYQGSVSTIIKSIIETEFTGLTNAMVLGQTIDTADNANEIRYRTHMTLGKFIESRLVQYALGRDMTVPNAGSPTFIYTNIDNGFEIVDYKEIPLLNKYFAIDPSHPDLPQYKQLFDDSTKSTSILLMTSLIIELGNKGLWELSSPSLRMMYHLDGSVKGINDDPVLVPLTPISENKFEYITNTKDPSLPTKVYLDDSQHDYEEISTETSYKYARAMMENHQFNIICLPNLNIQVGRFCELYISDKSSSTPSIFSQDYLIEVVSQVFRGYRCQTQVRLTTPTNTFTKATSISSLFHT